MVLPYKVATLLYCFNERDEVLLLERAQEPNRGFWSPCGGKLKMDIGESPYACACREAEEEIGVNSADGLASGRTGQRTRLSGPDALADVFVRGESEVGIAPAGPCRRPVSIFPAGDNGFAENSPDRPRANLALVLAISRRIFRRPLPLPSGRAE